jgi:hypothetical protein
MSINEQELIDEQGDIFEDLFCADIESWFSADIACCDKCYDDFLNAWPLAFNANDGKFQCQSIDLKSFHSGSKRISQHYTTEEFDVLIELISCPRCNESLSGHIWPYELPFKYEVDQLGFENSIKEIVDLSETTPFLLLSNDFAHDTFELLKKIAQSTPEKLIEQSLFRARVSNQIEELNFEQFSFPPKKFIQEGRYNHAGQQVLYTASDLDTCFREVREVLCYIAEFKLKKEIKILDLSVPDESHSDFESELSALVFSSLMSRELDTEGYHKPCYVFSRFIADCAKLAGFDAIKYPSTKVVKDNFNLVILSEFSLDDSIEFLNICLKDSKRIYALEIET